MTWRRVRGGGAKRAGCRGEKERKGAEVEEMRKEGGGVKSAFSSVRAAFKSRR